MADVPQSSPAARLLRATSSTFSGGAIVHPPAQQESSQLSESTPLQETRNRRRDEVQNRVHQRLLDEITSGFKIFVFLIAVLVLSLMLFILFLFVRAVSASIFFVNKPCDQPMLQYYMLVTMAWSQVPSTVSDYIRQRLQPGPIGSLLLRTACSIPGWLVIAYGIYMVESAKTCQKTNPQLYWPLRSFIYAQVLIAALALTVTILALLNIRHILHMLNWILNAMHPQCGCEKAVHNLPKIEKGSAELFDPEDGSAVDCCICMDSLPSSELPVVRAPCAHCFHEECLASWCKNHVDCPLCRQQVGEAEVVDTVSTAV
eukprot:TRINITY_DN107115_c0_g1_i1.p1 TRINITY_DN107115_c0_g1~~TRINITY_DN107115_c0_g1_i1.p1  ORF type:complete len:316 (+),score=32.32 TRINITY_DN107115_c0_g1_i1:60-1007(+)